MSQAAYARSPYPPVLGYTLGPDIAEGGFSRVFKAYNPQAPPPGYAAVKVIATKAIASSPHAPPDPATLKRIVKEIQVHATLKHTNVLELFGSHDDAVGDIGAGIPPAVYIVLAYAVGGDLFDQIVPDVGLSEDGELAAFYFYQLMAGVHYCHGRGVCHRDLKPENLLLDGNGNLQISDFGLCSVFRYKGEERMLSEPCGSPPYAAPELAFGRQYRAEPIDMWSCGVILFTLLVGNTPWDEPTARSPEFAAYLSGELLLQDPWTRIPKDALSLLRKLLHVKADRRASMAEVSQHPWFRRALSGPKSLLGPDGLARSGATVAERLTRRRIAAGEVAALADDEFPALVNAVANSTIEGAPAPTQDIAQSQRGRRYLHELSLNPTQPFSCTVQLYTQNPILATQRANTAVSTSFISRRPLAELVQAITAALAGHHIDAKLEQGHGASERTRLSLRFLDNRKQLLTGYILIQPARSIVGSDAMECEDDAADEWLVLFRKRKGDVVHWKRVYRSVLDALPQGMVVAR